MEPTMIVKIQRPLETNFEIPAALVYNQDRSTYAYVPFTEAVSKFMGDELKIYAEVNVIDGNIYILRIVPPQDW